jgi:hypothetical protein
VTCNKIIVIVRVLSVMMPNSEKGKAGKESIAKPDESTFRNRGWLGQGRTKLDGNIT